MPSFRHGDSFLGAVPKSIASGGSIHSVAAAAAAAAAGSRYVPGPTKSPRSMAIDSGRRSSSSIPSALSRSTRSGGGAVTPTPTAPRAGRGGVRSPTPMSAASGGAGGVGATAPQTSVGGTKRNARGGAKRLSFVAAATAVTGPAGSPSAGKGGGAADGGVGGGGKSGKRISASPVSTSNRGVGDSATERVEGGGDGGGGGGGVGGGDGRAAKRAKKTESHHPDSKPAERGGVSNSNSSSSSRKKKKQNENAATLAQEVVPSVSPAAPNASGVTLTGAVCASTTGGSLCALALMEEDPPAKSLATPRATGAHSSTGSGTGKEGMAMVAVAAAATKITPGAQPRQRSRIAKAFAAPSLFGTCSRLGAFGDGVARTPRRAQASAGASAAGRGGWREDGKGKWKGRGSSDRGGSGGGGGGSSRRGAKGGGGEGCWVEFLLIAGKGVQNLRFVMFFSLCI